MIKPAWTWLAAVPILAALIYSFERQEAGESLQTEEVAVLPRYTLTDADLVRYNSDGDMVLRGKASSIEYFDDDSRHAADLDADLLSDSEVRWHLTSPTATEPQKDRRILLEDKVVAKGQWPDSEEPLTATTSRVWVDPETRQFETSEPVAVDSEDRKGTAIGMRVDWQEHRLQLLRSVKMTYAAP